MDMAWADLVCGYTLATIVAAWAVGPRARPAGVDFTMAELVAARFNEFVATASIDPTSDGEVDRRTSCHRTPPTGCTRRAMAGSRCRLVTTERFKPSGGRSAIPKRSATRGSKLSRDGGRAAAIWTGPSGAAISSLDAEELAAALRRCGVYAEKVIPAQELPSDPHLSARQFFAPVDHPEWGRRRLIGVPWRPEGGPPLRSAHLPRLETVDPASVPGL